MVVLGPGGDCMLASQQTAGYVGSCECGVRDPPGAAAGLGRAGADNENERPCLVPCWGRGGPGRGAELQDWLRCPARPAARPTTDWAPGCGVM